MLIFTPPSGFKKPVNTIQGFCLTIFDDFQEPVMVHLGKGGEAMLRMDEQKAVREKVRERVDLLPEPVRIFLTHVETTRSISTTYEYTKDLHLFCGYLMAEKKEKKNLTAMKNVANAPVNAAKKHQVVSFLDYLSTYERTFETPAGNESVQQFENTVDGKNRKLATLKAYYAFAYTQGWTAHNVSDELDLWKDTVLPSTEYLTEADMDLFFSAIRKPATTDHGQTYQERVVTRDVAICTCLFYLGLKVGEITNLNLAHIFPDENGVWLLRRNQPPAFLTLPDAAYTPIRTYYDERLADGFQTRGEDPFFLSMQQKRINAKTVRQMLLKYQAQAGIHLRITPQVMRRSFARRHYQTHQNLPLLARVLGHKTVEPVIRYYLTP